MIDRLTAVNDVLVAVMDAVLGWMTHLPMDLRLVILAVGTSAILTFVRLFATDQDLLRRCRRDKRTLKALLRQAKRDRNKEAAQRYRATLAMIAAQSMKAELKPLLVAVLPIACLACWAAARMTHVPLAPGEPVEVRAYTSAAAVGELVHIVPVDGLAVEEGWIRPIAPDRDDDGHVTNGVARWTVRAERAEQPYLLLFRHRGRTVAHPLAADGKRTAAALAAHDDDGVVVTEVALRPYKLMGVIPGWPKAAIPPWLTGYLLIAIPVVPALKRLARIR